jgi:hypothetical protein
MMTTLDRALDTPSRIACKHIPNINPNNYPPATMTPPDVASPTGKTVSVDS